MKKKAQRSKLPLLAFEAESWPVDIKYRKAVPQVRRLEKTIRTAPQKPLRLVKTQRLAAQKHSLPWSTVGHSCIRAGNLAR